MSPSPLSSNFMMTAMKALERKASALQQVAQFVTSLDDINNILDQILDKVMEVVDAEGAILAMADRSTGAFYLFNPRWINVPEIEASERENILKKIKVKLKDGIIGQVYQSKEPQLVSDISKFPSYRKDIADLVHYEINNLMAVPLMIDDVCFGVLELSNKKGKVSFTAEDLDLASALSNQIALVLEALRLRKESAEKNSEALHEIPEQKPSPREEELSKELESVRQEQEKSDQRVRQLTEELEDVYRSKSDSKERIKELSEQVDSTHRLRQETLKQMKELAEEIEGMRQAQAQSEGKVKESEDRAKESEDKAKKIEEELKSSMVSHDTLDQAQKDFEEKNRHWEKELAAARAEVMQAQKKTEDLDRQLKEYDELLQTDDTQVNELTQKLEEARKQIKELSEKKEVEKKHASKDDTRQVIRLLELVKAVNSIFSLDAVLRNLLKMAGQIIETDKMRIFLWDEEKNQLYCAVRSDNGLMPDKPAYFDKGTGIVGWTAANQKIAMVSNVDKDERFVMSIDGVSGKAVQSVLAVPISTDAALVGVAEALTVKGEEPFGDAHAQMLLSLCSYAAMAIQKARFYDRVEKLFIDTVSVLADAIETKSHIKKGRSQRLRRMVSALAGEMNLSGKELWEVEMAALLHDVGKISVPEKILNKHGDLKERELDVLMGVPVVGAEMLSSVKQLQSVATLIRHVNERWDGKGYPDHSSGENIPLGSRIISVANTYEAMTSDRPYRKGLPEDVAMKELMSYSGVQFDPACVKAFLNVYQKGKLK